MYFLPNMIQITLNNRIASDHEPLKVLQSNMRFDYPWEEGEYYAFLVIDPLALPDVFHSLEEPYFLHYYETNIVKDNNQRTNIVIPYYPPQQIGHEYTYLLFKQPGKLNDFHINERTGFDLEAEISHLRLIYLDSKVIVST